jgi:NAD+ synthase (glutamine-hydrolysing)
MAGERDMSDLRLVLAQLNLTVGDIEGNKRQVEAGLEEARLLGADIVAFPEMALTGYPPEDLLLKPDFIQAAREALDALLPATGGLVAIIGLPYAGDDLYNAAAVLQNGRLVDVYRKHYLPNYSVFDEERYFQSGSSCPVLALGDLRVGVSICEDIWYPSGPHEVQALQGGSHLLINISASPYRRGYLLRRERMIATRAADNAAFVAYCNLVGGQDELVFDGSSLVCGPDGEIVARGPAFETAMIAVDLDMRQVMLRRLHDPRRRKEVRKGIDSDELEEIKLAALAEKPAREAVTPVLAPPLTPVAEVYQALVLGARDYVGKNGFSKVVLGLSGGVDSSVTAALAAAAVGPENVVGVAMPSRYTSDVSLHDAAALADNLGIDYRVIPIDAAFQAYLDMLSDPFTGLEQDTTEENIQARIRGNTLMALSNKFGWLVLTTGNKSEVAVGYFTIYGDSAGGFSVIKDVTKTLVYELGRYMNEQAGRPIIPDRVLTRAPSAELRPDQKDSDSLPPYEILDPILHAYVDEALTPEEIVRRGFKRQDVARVIGLIDRSEYKRRQSPPGVKISPRAFGKDWRLPITNAYRQPISKGS